MEGSFVSRSIPYAGFAPLGLPNFLDSVRVPYKVKDVLGHQEILTL